MKYGMYTKFNQDVDNDTAKAEFKKQVQSEYRKKLKTGILLKPDILRLGYDGEDVINNRITAVMRFDAVKVPRIVSNYLLNPHK